MDYVAHHAPLSLGFSRQEYWSGLPCRPPEDLPNRGIEPKSPALQSDFLPLNHQGSLYICMCVCVHVCVCTHIYMCIYIRVYIYIYTHTHIYTHTVMYLIRCFPIFKLGYVFSYCWAILDGTYLVDRCLQKLSVYALSFHSLHRAFHRTEIFNFNKIKLNGFLKMDCAFLLSDFECFCVILLYHLRVYICFIYFLLF